MNAMYITVNQDYESAKHQPNQNFPLLLKFVPYIFCESLLSNIGSKKIQVGKDQGKAQSEKDSHSKNRGGKKPN